MSRYVALCAGDPAPWFTQRAASTPRYSISTTAGRYVVLCFLGNAADPHSQKAMAAALARPDLFDDVRASFFGISLNPADEAEGRVANRYPGYRFIWDFDGTASRLYGVLPEDAAPGGRYPVRRLWFVLDPTLRIRKVIPFAEDGSDISKLIACLEQLPEPARFAGVELQAPILYLPDVFEPELCHRLMDEYMARGGEESGFMREEDGKTVMAFDPGHKRRKDVTLEDPQLISLLQSRIRRRIVPEIAKVHQFHVTRMERNIVSCYSAEDEGHFRPHRDNTTRGTAHRRFAVSINLNDDFEGGEVSFPEYGPRSFKAPAGGAVVFSCSLLHAVSRVTRGRRYAFLPFLYDEAAAQLREENSRYLAEGLPAYSTDS